MCSSHSVEAISFFLLFFSLRSCEGRASTRVRKWQRASHSLHTPRLYSWPIDRVIVLRVPTRDSCACPCEQRFSPRLSNKHVTIFFLAPWVRKKRSVQLLLKDMSILLTVLLMLAHFRALENFRFLLLMACAGLEVKTFKRDS